MDCQSWEDNFRPLNLDDKNYYGNDYSTFKIILF